MGLLSAPFRAAARVGDFLCRAATATLGHVSWQPPGWLRAIAASVRARPGRYALAALALAGQYAYRHRKLSPPPRLVHATIRPPDVPPLEKVLRRTDLVVRFDASAAALGTMTAPVPMKLVRLEPATPGEWRWDGDRRLVFHPEG